MPGKLVFIVLLLVVVVQSGAGQGRSIGNEPNSPMIRILRQASDRVDVTKRQVIGGGSVCQPNRNCIKLAGTNKVLCFPGKTCRYIGR